MYINTNTLFKKHKYAFQETQICNDEYIYRYQTNECACAYTELHVFRYMAQNRHESKVGLQSKDSPYTHIQVMCIHYTLVLVVCVLYTLLQHATATRYCNTLLQHFIRM